MMRLVPPSGPSDRPFEQLPGGGSYNAGNRATHAEFCARALSFLGETGATLICGSPRIGPIRAAAVVATPDDDRWVVLAHGTFDDGPRAGIRRSDTLKKVGFDVVALRRWTPMAIIVVTSNLPTATNSRQLLEVLRDHADEVVAIEGDLAGFHRLRALFGGIPVPLEPAVEVRVPGRLPGQLSLLETAPASA